jgi:hypothetical protein
MGGTEFLGGFVEDLIGHGIITLALVSGSGGYGRKQNKIFEPVLL